VQGGRIAFVCAVLAGVVGLAGVVAAVRHEEPTVVATQGELPVEVPPLPPTPDEDDDDGEVVPKPGDGSPAPAPLPVPAPSPERPEAAQPAPADDPYAAVQPPGTLRPTRTTPQPAAKPSFDPAAYDLTTPLSAMFDSAAHGQAGAERLSANVWQVTVVAEDLIPGTEYSIIVTRPEPSWGTRAPRPARSRRPRRGGARAQERSTWSRADAPRTSR